MTTISQPENGVIECHWLRQPNETRHEVEVRMVTDTFAAADPTDERVRWEGNFLIYQVGITPRDFFGTVLQLHVGEYFQNDAVVCPTCKRVNEHK